MPTLPGKSSASGETAASEACVEASAPPGTGGSVGLGIGDDQRRREPAQLPAGARVEEVRMKRDLPLVRGDVLEEEEPRHLAGR